MSIQQAPSRPPPPAPVRKPGQVRVVRALYAYSAQQSDELCFEEGDILYIIDQSDGNWWKARRGRDTGLIPSNYVANNTEDIQCPMHEAAKRGNVSFLQECINNNVSVNGLDKAGCTPLHWAAHGGHTECAELILEVPRCQVNVQNKLGDTPLHSASWKGHPQIVELLLSKGADTKAKNNENKQPSDLAKDPQVLAYLKQSATPANYNDEYGEEEDSD